MKTKYLRFGDIPLIEIDNELGLRVQLCAFGATIYAIYFNDELMTLTPKLTKDFVLPNIYYGKTIGAIAGRVKNGIVKINDKEYQLQLNEGENALHGGKYCASRYLFERKITNNNSIAFSVRFAFKKQNMKDGLPGKVEYDISYYVSAKDNVLLLSMRAFSNKDTVLALTNHSYFNLGEPNIDNLYLTIDADKFVHPNEKDLLPEELRHVDDVMSFKKSKRVIQDINNKYLRESKTKGYDHFYLFNNNDNKNKITLENKKYKLEISSTFEGSQIYTDNYEDGAKVLGTDAKLHRAIAIEPMDNPLDRKVLKKKELYNKEIMYTFSKKVDK